MGNNGGGPVKLGRIFLRFKIFDNRVEIMKGMFPFRRKSVIPYRNIADISVSNITRTLEIETNSGKKKKFAVGKDVYKVRDTIAERM